MGGGDSLEFLYDCFHSRLGGEISSIVYFHPEKWGRWTHFDEQIFSKGLVKPPTIGIVLLCWALIFWRHPNLIRFLWLKTKSRKNIVCRLKLPWREWEETVMTRLFYQRIFGSCQCTICYSTTVLHSVSEGPFHILLLQDYYIGGSSGSIVLNAQRNPQSPHEHLPQLKTNIFPQKRLVGGLEDFFDKWSLFVKKHFVGWVIFSPRTPTIWYTPKNIDPEKTVGFQ